MRTLTSITLGFLFVLFFNGKAAYTNNTEGCEQIKITYTTTPVAGTNEIKIEIHAKGGVEPYYYVFLTKDNKFINWNFDKNVHQISKAIAPDRVRVIDGSGCIKLFQLNESDSSNE